MKIITSILDLRTQIQTWRTHHYSIAFVPTMGNLHAGHTNLVKQAHTVADKVIVSIFVNPLQFGVGEDYQTYPRTLEADCEKLTQVNADAVFTPSVTNIYARDIQTSTRIQVPGLSDILCGASRPGHFVGVATIVNKLFNLVQPDKALFGQKDYQQLLVIKRMVTDLAMPIEIIGVPTTRESDGLAMSSRNGYLDAKQRAIAPRLFQVLDMLRVQIEQGNHQFDLLEKQAVANLAAAGFIPDYVAVRCAQTLAIPTAQDNALAILAAAQLGRARLIDNVLVSR